MTTRVYIHKVEQTLICPVTKCDGGYLRHYHWDGKSTAVDISIVDDGRSGLEVMAFSLPRGDKESLKHNYAPCEGCEGREEPCGPKGEGSPTTDKMRLDFLLGVPK